MKLSLSVRIAEAPCKTKLTVPFRDLVQLAKELGYRAVCMRASAGGVQTPIKELEAMRQEVERAGLIVSMVTADSDVPLNNEHGPDSLRNIGPTLDVAEALGSDLIRVCLKTRGRRRACPAERRPGRRTRHPPGPPVPHDHPLRGGRTLDRLAQADQPPQLRTDLRADQPPHLRPIVRPDDAPQIRPVPDERLRAKPSPRPARPGRPRHLVPGRPPLPPHPALGSRRRQLSRGRHRACRRSATTAISPSTRPTPNSWAPAKRP